MKKIITNIIILLVIGLSNADAQHKAANIAQDVLWERIQKEMQVFNELLGNTTSSNKDSITRLLELQKDSIRILGLTYWKLNPQSKQGEDWLLWTLQHPPYIDGNASLWKTQYPEIKRQYISSLKSLDSGERKRKLCWLEIIEIRGELEAKAEQDKAQFQTIDKHYYFDKLIQLANLVSGTDFTPPFFSLSNFLFDNRKQLGINEEEALSLIELYKKSRKTDIFSWASRKEQFLKLQYEPLKWEFQTLYGDSIDLESLRGKVVLIDFWATYCSPCIEYMETIRPLYDHYRQHGFEVVSISLDKDSRRTLVQAIEQRLKLQWPIAIIGSSKEYETVWKRYGFIGVPQLLLLNKDGKVVLTNGILRNGKNLEREIQKLL